MYIYLYEETAELCIRIIREIVQVTKPLYSPEQILKNFSLFTKMKIYLKRRT